MGLSLIAFDTNHIKQYVFATNKLKEIRGASSLLDYLNRIVMRQLAAKYDAQRVFTNGGSGLFCVDTEQAHNFGKAIQQAYKEKTGGTASVTYVTQDLPDGYTYTEDMPRKNSYPKEEDIGEALELLQWKLQQEKQQPPEFIALPSHPFMRQCSSCGTEYADAGRKSENFIRDAGEGDELYCESCQKKRRRNNDVLELIQRIEKGHNVSDKEYLWDQVISRLVHLNYDLQDAERPHDFNDFTNFKGTKDYLALIYADANNMGQAMDEYPYLPERRELADKIDKAIYEAVCKAIAQHLRIADHLKPREQRPQDLKHDIFPFDILMLGGDDVLMVVPASVALDVALTIAERFRELAPEKRTLSASVVLVPVKYPFGLSREIAETALKFAKKKGADARAEARAQGKKEVDDTRINFLIVTGGSNANFQAVYEAVYHKKVDKATEEFFATLRPFTLDDLRTLLAAIRAGHELNLGRTKLHQLREAVLQMNLTTSVVDGMALLSNWRAKQRLFVVQQVYEFGGRYQLPRINPRNPASGFPRVTFPWFNDGEKAGKAIYRTSLLDFVELYDFLSREVANGSDEN